MADHSKLRVFISSDNHIGYDEKDVVCGNDSFEAFKEVFELAKAAHADLIVLGGKKERNVHKK